MIAGIGIIAPNQPGDRKLFWKELCRLREEFGGPWCIRGDFNEVLSIGERSGCMRRSMGMKDFINFFSSFNLVDLPMLGRRFTRCNAVDGAKWSRLDRFLLHPEWLERFNFKLWGLSRFGSNHCPILMKEDDRL